MANTTWSTTDKAASITLSGGNLTATATAVSTALRAIDRQVSGKFYWEYTFGTWSGANSSVGFATTVPPTAVVAASPVGACVVLKSSGAINVNGVATGSSLGVLVATNVVGVAIDLTAQLAWMRVGAAGNWNGSGTANPATGTGGFSINSIGGIGIPLYPYAAFGASTDAVTANFGDSSFVGSVPSGFTSGFTAGATVNTNALATQSSLEHWLTTNPPAQVTQVALEHWTVNSSVTVQALATQVALEHWASVAEASTGTQVRAIIMA